jgi:hypothetical protein
MAWRIVELIAIPYFPSSAIFAVLSFYIIWRSKQRNQIGSTVSAIFLRFPWSRQEIVVKTVVQWTFKSTAAVLLDLIYMYTFKYLITNLILRSLSSRCCVRRTMWWGWTHSRKGDWMRRTLSLLPSVERRHQWYNAKTAKRGEINNP